MEEKEERQIQDIHISWDTVQPEEWHRDLKDYHLSSWMC